MRAARTCLICATFATLPCLFRQYLRRFVTIGCLALLRLSALLGLLSRVEQKFYEGIPLENGRTSSKKVLSSRVFLNQDFENSNPNLKPIRDLLAKPDILRK